VARTIEIGCVSGPKDPEKCEGVIWARDQRLSEITEELGIHV